MKKIVDFIKKYKTDFFVIFVFFIYILGKILTKELNNLDEIWQFNLARNVANGLIPYNDFNLITTPGLYFICGIVLKIFGTELFYMRIMATILCTSIVYVSYKVLNELGISNKVSISILFGIVYLFIDCFCIDYNFAILLIALISLYIELKNTRRNELLSYNKKKDFIIGILIGLAILMKQTAGIVFAFCIICYKICGVRSKNELLTFLKIAITRAIGMFSIVMLLIFYLVITNSFKEFINYAVLGVKEFTNTVQYTKLFMINLSECLLYKDFKTISIAALSIMCPITLLIELILVIKKQDKKIITLFGYALSTYIIVYPIADEIHFLIASLITVINIIYLFWKILSKITFKKINSIVKKYFSIFVTFCITVNGIMLIIYSCVNINAAKINKYNKLANFENIPVNENLCDVILSTGKYINNASGKIYIVDARAAIFMIPLNRYNKDYDMFNNGNLGENGTTRIIDDLENTKGKLKVLIAKDEVGFNWQTPMEVIDFIKCNFTKIDEIGMFDVYESRK